MTMTQTLPLSKEEQQKIFNMNREYQRYTMMLDNLDFYKKRKPKQLSLLHSLYTYFVAFVAAASASISMITVSLIVT